MSRHTHWMFFSRIWFHHPSCPTPSTCQLLPVDHPILHIPQLAHQMLFDTHPNSIPCSHPAAQTRALPLPHSSARETSPHQV